MTANRLTDCIVLLALSLCGTAPLSAADSVDYLKQIKPLLRTKCQSCHGALKQNSSFRVDTAEFLRKGGDSGPGFEPGKADDSLLLGVLTGDAGFKMPPEGAGKP
ncbi:MAG: c-type cytochrome domain-containing protein, partial [Gimesia chilikensis]